MGCMGSGIKKVANAIVNFFRKVINFFYNSVCKKLIVYQDVTTRDQIVSAVHELFDIPSEKHLRFRGEDGILVVMCAALPNDIDIFVEIND